MKTSQSGSLGRYGTDSTNDVGPVYDYGSGQDGGGRERGTRRRKVYGYLKAANELRQSYSAQWAQKTQDYDYDIRDTPGGFPELGTTRLADEEMVLFPSYAKRHVRKEPKVDYRELALESQTCLDDPQSMGNMESWRTEWERYEHDNAIVDVDVRGWIYTPHIESMSRKNRILIALARRLSGIPAPHTVSTENRPSSASLNEEAVVDKQEQSIIHLAESNADPEWRANARLEGIFSRPEGDQSSSFNSPEEIAAANARLLERLQPFLAHPTVSVPITIFFYDQKNSQSRTVSTNDGGHFSVRAALDFVPTHIRVLASENLSASEEITITESSGISLISDIDDTIKHSAIASGTREIFRNTFVRNLEDLTVLGVKEWYSKLTKMGVKIHYVSNSPWQLYPFLQKFFRVAGLPPGSFHLKQYSGMLQGIFEPAAEKKRPILESIMLDFPNRRFILVGDSGEADLEVYTELALANPGRILAIFIRDVTTSPSHKFFDTSVTQFERPPTRTPTHGPPLPERLGDQETLPPILPPRNYPNPKASGDVDLSAGEELSGMDNKEPSNGTSESRQIPPIRPSKPAVLRSGAVEGYRDNNVDTVSSSIRRKPAPPLPAKPIRLSSSQSQGQAERLTLPIRSTQKLAHTGPQVISRFSTNEPPVNNDSNNRNEESYTSTVPDKAANMYDQLPSARPQWKSIPTTAAAAAATHTPSSTHQTSSSRPTTKEPPPPVPPPRRSTTQSFIKQTSSMNRTAQNPSGAAQDLRMSNTTLSQPPSSSTVSTTPPRLARSTTNIPSQLSQPSSSPSPYPNSSISSSSVTPGPAAAAAPMTFNKREDMWNRRWARAKEILDRQGVLLMTWRAGDDVHDVCVGLVESAEREGRAGGSVEVR
ncbi:actin patch protein [Histoplasma ohiense]|nr:actin patch protein [Histoplasma ohiense (nom. inval.)]